MGRHAAEGMLEDGRCMPSHNTYSTRMEEGSLPALGRMSYNIISYFGAVCFLPLGDGAAFSVFSSIISLTHQIKIPFYPWSISICKA